MSTSSSSSLANLPKLKLTLKLSCPTSGKSTPTPPPPPLPQSNLSSLPSSPVMANAVSKPHVKQQSATVKKQEKQVQVVKPKVKNMKHLNDGLKPRPCRLVEALITNLAGYSFTVPAWSRDIQNLDVNDRESSMTRDQIKQPATFVCPQEGCHKIFDDRSKWRRHQRTHK